MRNRTTTHFTPRRRAWRRAMLVLLLAWVVGLAGAPAAGMAAPAAGRAAVMVELAAPPTAQLYAATLAGDPAHGRAAATRAAQAHLARVEAAQRDLLPRLAQLDATVLYRTQRVYNGVATLVDRAQLAALAHLPGVKAVHPLLPKTPDVARSAPHIGAPALWEGVAGLPAVQGEGVRIGIIDTGIDYLHVDFGGPGTGYSANDRRVIGDVAGFPSLKIAGGYDFVGETYNADPTAGNYQPVPEPDPDPYDCYGHGTHVAGIAGGYGVTTAGATYTGSYTDDLDPAGFVVGPGVAPRAELYALKVFGCAGSSGRP
jgi:subtilisin family serine protease